MKVSNKNRFKKPCSKSNEKTIVVVLGMPGDELAVLTHGLELLGVTFCDRLLAKETNTAGGNGIKEINFELDKRLGNNWRKISALSADELSGVKYVDLNLQAIENLRPWLQDHPYLALNLPEPHLLPFWQKVFADLRVKVVYLLLFRNPLAMISSLDEKASLYPEKCYYLWLEHILSGLYFSQGATRIVLNYDDLVTQTEKKMTKIAGILGLDGSLHGLVASRFDQGLITMDAKYVPYDIQAVFADPLAPISVRTAISLLEDMAADKLNPDSENITGVLTDLAKQTDSLVETLLYSKADAENPKLRSVADNENSVEKIGSQTMQDKVNGGASRVIAQKNHYIGLLHENLAEQFETISSLRKVSEVRESDIDRLNQDVIERDDQILALTQLISDKDKALHQAHINLIQHGYSLQRAHQSLAWKLVKPLRFIKNFWAYHFGGIKVNLIPLAQLSGTGSEWLATGNDAQFLLATERAWHRLAGWYWLELKIVAEQPLNAQLFFDTGEGFDPHRIINFLIQGNGWQRIPVFIPYHCQAVRLDPCDVDISFKLSSPVLKRLKDAPRLPAEFLSQASVYEALGGRDGNVCSLVSGGGVSFNNSDDYCWRSEDGDPWFTVKDFKHKLRPGWYVLEVCVSSDVKYGNAKLYFDFGTGYSESVSVEVPFNSEKVYKRLFKLAAVPQQIRFDPIDRLAKFSIKRLHFFPVPAFAAYYFMLKRLRNRSLRHKDKPFLRIWRALRVQAKSENTTAHELLCELYNKTFICNRQNSTLAYSDWIDRVEEPEFDDLATIQIVQKFFKYRPTISVVMPVYNVPELYLRKAIESVLVQSYPNWELCIADDASTDANVRVVLEEYMLRDPRIKVVFRQQNGHISAASNSALTLATGEYVALLDHDDEFARHALHFMVEAINRQPAAQILYSDEDKIDEQEKRFDPHFKSDWNPDLFFSQNYVSHLGVYRRELLARLDGFRIGVEGSQDQDLLLRCLPFVKDQEIIHIPKILYHWRILEGSTALGSGEKNYTTNAGIKALQDYFSAQNREDVSVEIGLVPNTYRVRYSIPEPEPLVSLLIPTRDMLAVLEPCIRSIIDKTTYRNYEIIILDNGSVESATLDYFEHIQVEDNRIKVIPYNYPFNYSAINNFGVKHAKGELIGLINNDIEVISPEWLTEMVSHALRPEIGCVGAKLYYDDETIQHAGVILGLGGVAGHSHKYFPREAPGYFHRLKIVQNLSAVTAACLIVRKSIFEQVGGLEEENLRVAFNDVDFCLKVREAGYRNLWTPYAELYHHESKSRGAEDTPEKIERFNKEVNFIKNKWGTILLRDPYYSRNLTLNREDFSL